MRLDELINEAKKAMPVEIVISGTAKSNFMRSVVEGITDNTKETEQGFIFVCVRGARFDGHDFAEEMLEKGALCVVTEEDLGIDRQLIVSDSRVFYGHLCVIWFNHPERRMKLIGVTGTNGKTTLATMIKDILTSNGHQVGFIGTTGALIKGKPVETDGSTPTTPRAFELYKLFSEMAKSGCDTVVMEVSSFALEQNRIGPAMFRIGIFTNLTQDHLDYHGNMDNYFEAKRKLFTDHCETAIINIDDDYGLRLYEEMKSCGKDCVSCSISGQKADITGGNISFTDGVTKFWVAASNKNHPFSLHMMGAYNVLNAVQAIAACLKLNLNINHISSAMTAFGGVKGRCEFIPTGKDFLVICDYAHSPDALENLLPNIKENCRGRLICLFGCGGDRDKTKRPLMAAAAEKYADMLVITSDNPRNENPNDIIDDIVGGLSYTKPYMRIVDRKAAIHRAIAIAEKDDIIVLAGKGHEDYQVLRDEVHIHFDEREIVREIMHNYTRKRFDPNLPETLSINEIIDAVSGKPYSIRNYDKSISMSSIFSDTRNVIQGGIFVAIKGERFDGHEFAKQAVEGGAAFAITERTLVDVPSIVVKSTRKALLDLARYFRNRFKSVVVGVTGSVGKTTTKEMIALALSCKHGVCKTPVNRNNEIGLPFTIFTMNHTATATVLEMGMNHFGEIERLSRASNPNICVITNIGVSHIENLGSQEGILEAKLEILKGSDRNAPLIVNGDDPLLAPLKEDYSGYREIITYGIESENVDYRAVDIITENDRICFRVKRDGEFICDVVLFCLGTHNIYNALASIAVAVKAGCDPVAAAEMLSGYQPDALRQHVTKMGEQTVIVDCYNASPTSMMAALNMLSDMKPKNGGRRVAVLGDMLELGEHSEEFHSQVGEYVAKKGIDMLVCYGKNSVHIANRANELGMNSAHSEDKNIILNFMKYKLRPNDIVLFKASRGMHLEEIIEEFYKDC